MSAAAERQALCRAEMTYENSSSRLRVRYRTTDVRRRLVRAQPFIDDLAQKGCPLDEQLNRAVAQKTNPV